MNLLNCKDFTNKIYATELHKAAIGMVKFESYSLFSFERIIKLNEIWFTILEIIT